MEAGLALGSTAAVFALVAAGIAAKPEDEATAQRALEAAQEHLEAVRAKKNKKPSDDDVPGWGHAVAPDGRTYWWDLTTNKTQWNKPGTPPNPGDEPKPGPGDEPPPKPEPVFSSPACKEVFEAIERGTPEDLDRVKELFGADPKLALCTKDNTSTRDVYTKIHSSKPSAIYEDFKRYLSVSITLAASGEASRKRREALAAVEAEAARKRAEAAAAAEAERNRLEAAAAAEAERNRLAAEAAAAAEAERKRLAAEAAAAAEAERKRLAAEAAEAERNRLAAEAAAAAAAAAGRGAGTKLEALERVAAALQPGPDKDQANANVAKEKARLQRYNEEEAERAEYHRRHAEARPARVAAGTAKALTPEQLAAVAERHASAAAERQRRRAAGENVPTPPINDEPFTPRASGGRRRVLTFRRKPKSRSKNGRRPTRKSSVRRNR